MLLAVVLLLGAVPAAAFAGFADVPADAWYAPAVQTCAEQGLFQGTSPTTFSPGAIYDPRYVCDGSWPDGKYRL